MYKLKNSYIDNIIKSHCSNAEIDFILNIAEYQDEFGVVHSVYYKNICEKCNFSYQTFYNVLNSLYEKGLINYQKNHLDDLKRKDFTITINNNDFSDDDFSKGYLNVASLNFKSDKFKKLKAGEKLLFLYMQRFTQGWHLLLDNFYDRFCNLFDVSRKTMQIYLHTLKKLKLLGVGHKRNKNYNYEICIKKTKTIINKVVPNEKDRFKENVKQLIMCNFSKYVPWNNKEKFLNDITSLLDRLMNRCCKNNILRRLRVDYLIDAMCKSIDVQQNENGVIRLNAAHTNTFFTQIVNSTIY